MSKLPSPSDLIITAERVPTIIDRPLAKYNIPPKIRFIFRARVWEGLNDAVKESELITHIAETAAGMIVDEPNMDLVAGYVLKQDALNNSLHQKFSDCFTHLVNDGRLDSSYLPFIEKYKEELNAATDHHIDTADIKFIAYRIMQKGYMVSSYDRKVMELPAHMWMRVALQISDLNDINDVITNFEKMSGGYFTHATPTLFNACTKQAQLSSCFLLTVTEDSVEGIYDTVTKCAVISKHAGGIGVSVSGVRGRGALIKGSNSEAEGLVPFMKVLNETARYINQGGKRKGAFAVYLEPWHSDIEEFLELKKNHGVDELRARDLFYAMWMPDLFMERMIAGQQWSLFNSEEAMVLCDLYGAEFKAKYEELEADGKASKVIDPRSIWRSIITSQIETGTPYIHWKDSVNRKNSQMNLGTIRSSNLCSEVNLFTSPDEIAVCNLASLCLPAYVKGGSGDESYFDYEGLAVDAKRLCKNLNRVIDRNFYPLKEALNSNMRHRPMGIGVQGLADVFQLMAVPFDGDEARYINNAIFEAIYFGAVSGSAEEAADWGPYESFKGSPAHSHKLQFDLWNEDWDQEHSGKFDWDALKTKIAISGLRNSVVVSLMPTVSTSQIMGNCEAFEPYTSNLYIRKTLTGEYIIINPNLVNDLKELGIWDDSMKNSLKAGNGSVQNITRVPDVVKAVYKTAWEIKQKVIIDMAADRGKYVDQSQSMNLFMPDADFQQIHKAHVYGWKKGLKTGMYYLRTRPSTQATQFTVMEDGDCEACGS
jgi:ribonucleoside-diphosphate reductase alpha chain